MTLRALLITLMLSISVDGFAHASILWTNQRDDATLVHLYFFWSQTCPHCREALPFIDALNSEYPWLEVHAAEISQSLDKQRRYADMASP